MGKYCYRLKYKDTDLLVTGGSEVSEEVREPVASF